jgi:Spy/CpxP family protein refolding chaperone
MTETQMKKILIGLGLAASVASTAIAQTPDPVRGKGERGGRGGEHGQMEGRRGGRGGPDGLLLKGITLTEGQRAQIAQLNKTERDKLGARKQNDGQFEKVRDARKRGDTAAVRAAMAQRRTQMEQERAQHIAAIRNVLTVDQRVQFDKNVAELKTREAERTQKFGERGNGKQRGARPGRGGQGQQFRGGR